MGVQLTAHELIGAIDAVRKGIALLFDKDALATGTAELVGQADGCKEGTVNSESSSEGSVWLPAHHPTTKVWAPTAERSWPPGQGTKPWFHSLLQTRTVFIR